MSSSSSSLRVALAQTCPVSAPEGHNSSSRPFEVVERNLRDAEEWVIRASEDGADVVVFPEYFLQGIVDQGRQYLTYPAQHALDHLQRLAIQHNISIVGTIVFPVFKEHHEVPLSSPFGHLSSANASQGSSEEVQAEWRAFVDRYPGKEHDPELQNTAIFIEGGTGKVIGKYVKRNLWHPERTYLSPGQTEHRVFDTKWGKCGFLICWDVSHPNSGQALTELGVEIVFAPTYWIGWDSAPTITDHHDHPPSYESEILSSLSCARSFETESVWIMCNAGGPEPEGYIGGSSVWMPLKGKLGGVKGVEVGYEIVNVDLTVLKKTARELYKIRTENNR